MRQVTMCSVPVTLECSTVRGQQTALASTTGRARGRSNGGVGALLTELYCTVHCSCIAVVCSVPCYCVQSPCTRHSVYTTVRLSCTVYTAHVGRQGGCPDPAVTQTFRSILTALLP